MTMLGATEEALLGKFDTYVRDRVRSLINDPLINEYRANPRGPHSDELSRVLNYFRRGDIRRKYALLAKRHFHEYQIVQLSGKRGQPPMRRLEEVYYNQRDADFAIFMLRVGDILNGLEAEQ